MEKHRKPRSLLQIMKFIEKDRLLRFSEMYESDRLAIAQQLVELSDKCPDVSSLEDAIFANIPIAKEEVEGEDSPVSMMLCCVMHEACRRTALFLLREKE